MFTILILLLLQDSPKVLNENFTVFSQKENFYILKKDSLHKYDENEWSATKHNLDLNNYHFDELKDNGNVYLIAKGGGKVLSFIKNKLKVIDNTNLWNSKYHSFNFIRDKTIYSFGGYGYFITRDDLIYFDIKSGEWFDFIKSHEVFDLNIKRKNSIGSYNKNTDELFIGLGQNEDKSYTNILLFDFKNKTWNKYADIGNKFGLVYKSIQNYKFPLIITKTQKITFDFLNKTYTVFENIDGVNSDSDSWHRISFNRFTNKFLIAQKKSEHTEFHVINENIFLGNNYSTYSFKKDVNKLTVFLGVLLALALALILIVFRFRKKETGLVKLNKNLKKIKSELDESDLIFFDKILRSHPKAVKYQDLMDMLDNTLAYETKIKKIAAAKIRIDTVLCKYCKLNDSIVQSKKNIHDSRIKEMFLKTD